MSTTEKHAFQAEIAQLLDIVIHSLYTDKEIFVRELISNAADASEKLKFLQTSGAEIIEPDAAAEDQRHDGRPGEDDHLHGRRHRHDARRAGRESRHHRALRLEGVPRTAQGEQGRRASLIGQFGVGFYSAFMVGGKSDRLHALAISPDEQGWIWTSDGQTGYEIEPAGDCRAGRKSWCNSRDTEFAQASNIERIIKRYSNFVPFPIELNGKASTPSRRSGRGTRSEIKDAEYDEFYKFIGHDSEPPLYRLHFSADAPLAIRALLFVPPKNLEHLTLDARRAAR